MCCTVWAEGYFDFLGEGAFRMDGRFLLQVAKASTGSEADTCWGCTGCVRELLSHQDTEEGCLSPTVAPDEAELLPGGD